MEFVFIKHCIKQWKFVQSPLAPSPLPSPDYLCKYQKPGPSCRPTAITLIQILSFLSNARCMLILPRRESMHDCSSSNLGKRRNWSFPSKYPSIPNSAPWNKGYTPNTLECRKCVRWNWNSAVQFNCAKICWQVKFIMQNLMPICCSNVQNHAYICLSMHVNLSLPTYVCSVTIY